MKIIEVEPKIMTTHGTVTASQLKSINEMEKQLREERKSQALENNTQIKSCPFKGNSLSYQCSGSCAFALESGCGLVSEERPKELHGICPISNRNCSDNCALWKDGCQFLNICG